MARAHAAVEILPDSYFRAAAQDRHGRILAAEWSQQHASWYEWTGHGFAGTNSNLTKDATAFSFQKLANDQIYSLWERKEGKEVIVLSHGTNHVGAVQKLRGPPYRIEMLVDSHNQLWITEAGTNIYRAAPNEPAKLVYTLSKEQLLRGRETFALMMTEDARERIWFWSSALVEESSRAGLKGFLIYDGKDFTHHPTLAGVTADRVTAVTSMGAKDFWIADHERGIFSIDLDTLEGTRFDKPSKKETVQRIFKVGDDIYVISGYPDLTTDEGWFGTLWRRNAGAWTKVFFGLDSQRAAGRRLAERDVLPLKEGLLVSGFGTGGWFIPYDQNGKAQQINWHAHSSFPEVDRWFKLGDEQIMGVSFSRGTFVAKLNDLIEPGKFATEIKQLTPMGEMVATEGGTIYATFLHKRGKLSQWNGERWREIDLPRELGYHGNGERAADSLERLWWISPDWAQGGPKCEIFDPASEQFSTFPNYHEALEAQVGRGTNFHLGRGTKFEVTFSADGRIAYFDSNRVLRYFDGTEWTEWQRYRFEIGYEPQPPRAPVFRPDGTLCVRVGNYEFCYNATNGWATNSLPYSERDDGTIESKARAIGLKNFPRPDSIATDIRGTHWLTRGGNLYRAGFGLVEPWFGPDEGQPFIDGRTVTEALIDKRGNVFLRTTLPNMGTEYIFLPVPVPSPKTSMTIEQNGDVITARLQSDTAKPRFSWRMDSGVWSDIQSNTVVHIEHAKNGHHRLEAITVADRLQTDAKAASAEFEVKVDQTVNIQHWIAQLADSDFSKREAAITSLAREPALALPALRKALKENKGDSWWLKAAVQQVENVRKNSGSSLEE